jgi:hypothetical protein
LSQPPDMKDSLPLDLMQALDLFALERTPHYTFVPITPPPAWFRQALPAVDVSGPLTLAAVLPYLERFLSDAESFWREGTRRSLLSGAFAASSGSEEVLLRACALNLGPHSLLVLERLRGQEDLRDTLQKARENKLEHEQLVKRIESLRVPMTSLSRLAKELAQSGLSGAHQELVDRIAQAVAQMDEVTKTLLPQKRRS